MTRLAGVRRRIQRLGPYPSLALLVVPVALVEPLKLIALLVAGCGSSAQDDVKSAVTDYLHALLRQDGAAACNGLSSTTRAGSIVNQLIQLSSVHASIVASDAPTLA